MSMYDYVADAVDSGAVLLEAGDGSSSNQGKPLLKDEYAAERRKAKVLNFSIAYGKTAFGLAKDFGVSTEEAQDTVDKWYEGRPQVKAWQDATIRRGETTHFVATLLGRQRKLHSLMFKDDRRKQKHYRAATRAAINTPIQGSAADIVMLAMVELEQHPDLRELGWKLLVRVACSSGPRATSPRSKLLLSSPLLITHTHTHTHTHTQMAHQTHCSVGGRVKYDWLKCR